MVQEKVLLVCLLSLLATRTGAIECTTSDFCRCEGTDGGKKFIIDVASILGGFQTNKIPDTSSAGTGKYTYTLSPCSPVTCVPGGLKDGVACQNDINSEVGLAYVARNTVPAVWTIGKLSPLQFIVVYGGGDKSAGPTLTRVAEVDFSEDTTNVIEMFDEVKNTDPEVLTLTYKFRVTGSGVAPGPGPSGKKGGVAAGVVGLVLMSVSLLGLITYFIAGALVQYYHLGARGVEVIPNVHFWKDLPHLIKDGFLFTISPCYKGRGAYQSL